jgi:chromosome segregation ATPase
MRDASRNLLCALLALAWPAAASLAQSPAPSQQPSQQSPPAGQSQSQPQTQTQSQSSTPPEQKQDSVAEAARKAKAKKAAAAQGKVFTEDDLSGMKKGGVSVVGNENVKRPRRAPASDGDGDYAPNSEEYWRSRSQPLLDEMAAIDQQIAQIKEDIKKYGPGGIDVTTGFKDNVTYIEDRNGQIQELQEKKAKMQKQLDDLAEEGPKAGAQPAWFR